MKINCSEVRRTSYRGLGDVFPGVISIFVFSVCRGGGAGVVVVVSWGRGMMAMMRRVSVMRGWNRDGTSVV